MFRWIQCLETDLPITHFPNDGRQRLLLQHTHTHKHYTLCPVNLQQHSLSSNTTAITVTILTYTLPQINETGPLHGPGPPSLPLDHLPPELFFFFFLERLEAVPLRGGHVMSPGPVILPLTTKGLHLPDSIAKLYTPVTYYTLSCSSLSQTI